MGIGGGYGGCRCRFNALCRNAQKRTVARIVLEPALRCSAGSVFPGRTHALQCDVFAGHSIFERGHGNGAAIRRPRSHRCGVVFFKTPSSKREGGRCGCVRGVGNVFACHAWQPLDHGFIFRGRVLGVVCRRCRGNLLPASWVSHERIRERISCRMRPAFGRSGAIPRCWLLEPSSRS